MSRRPTAPAETALEEHIAPAPRISIQAFCETVETAAAVQAAGEDRRMVKAHVKIQMGGVTAAVEAYRSSPTPNVIILESDNRPEDILAGLDQLAEVCDAGTRVVVVGRINDVTLYRELTRRGVSDYHDRAGRHHRHRARDLRPVFAARCEAGRPHHRRGRRQGRRRRLHRGAQYRLGDRARSRARLRWSPISISPSAPPASTTTRIRRRASPTRCSRPIASTPPSSTGCCRNAPST